MKNNTTASPREFDSIDLVQLMARNKAIILIALLLSMFVTYIVTAQFITPVYRAKAKILLQKEKLDPDVSFSVYDTGKGLSDIESEVLKSKRIVSLAAQKIDLTDKALAAMPEEALEVDRIQKGIATEYAASMSILTLSLEHENPLLAAALCNALVEAYIEDRQQEKTQDIERTLASLGDQIEKTNADLTAAEKELQTFSKEENVAVLLGSDVGLALWRYANHEQALVGLKADVEKTKAQLDEMKKLLANPSAATLPSIINSPLIRDLKALVRAAEAKRDELLANYTATHPAVVGIQNEINRLASEIENERNKILIAEIKGLEMEYVTLQRKEETTQKAQAEQQKNYAKVVASQPKITQLTHDIEMKRILLRDLLKKQNDIKILQDRSREAPDIRVIEPADVPQAPARPNMLVNLILGALIGLAIAFGVVLTTGGAGVTFKKQKPVEPVRRPEPEPWLAESKEPEGVLAQRQRAEPVGRRGDERRSTERNDVSYDVLYNKMGAMRACRTCDISASGMRIVTEEAMNKGTVLEFQINRPDMRPVAGKGYVVWSLPAQVNGKQGFYVAGLKFAEQPPNEVTF